MTEFVIIFKYQNRNHKARVMKTESEGAVEYDIRPVTPWVVKKFGKQIRIFRENETFSVPKRVDDEYRELFKCLVDAIRVREYDIKGTT